MTPKIKRVSAGALIQCTTTNKLLLLLRNDKNPSWSLVSGGINENEDILEGLKREFKEELSLDPSMVDFQKINIDETDNHVFHYYHGFTFEEFIPILDHENLNFDWFEKDKLPSPLFDGMKEKINTI